MTTLAQGQAAGAGIATPSPLCIRPRPRAAGADSGRATARAVLDDALRGIELTAIDRRFVSRLSQWDKRSATTVAALIAHARQAGRGEAQGEAQAGEAQTRQAQTGQAQTRGALTPGQLETVLAALTDAFAYRTCGASAAGCWDCASWASGLCAEHAKDADRAQAFAELAAALSGPVTSDAPVEQTGITAVTSVTPVTPTALSGYRRRAAVAS